MKYLCTEITEFLTCTALSRLLRTPGSRNCSIAQVLSARQRSTTRTPPTDGGAFSIDTNVSPSCSSSSNRFQTGQHYLGPTIPPLCRLYSDTRAGLKYGVRLYVYPKAQTCSMLSNMGEGRFASKLYLRAECNAGSDGLR